MVEPETSEETRRRITRRRGACRICRQKKVRCNGEKPCGHCKVHHVDCEYELEGSAPRSSNRHLRSGSQSSSAAQYMPPLTPITTQLDSFEFPSDASSFEWGFNLAAQPQHEFDENFHANIALDDFFSDPQMLVLQADNQGFGIADIDPDPRSMTGPESVLVLGAEEQPHTESDDSKTVRDVKISHGRMKSHHLYRRALFPASLGTDLSDTEQVSYNTRTTTLVDKISKTGKEIRKTQPVARIISRILSREQQSGLPTVWKSGWDEGVNQPIERTVLPLQELVTYCFAEPWGVRLYLGEAEARSIMDQASTGTICSSDIVDNYLCRTLTAWGLMLESEKNPVLICESLSLYLEAQTSIGIERNSLSKFIAMVASLQFAFQSYLEFLPAQLAATVSVILSLNLHSELALRTICANKRQIVRAKRACWVVFCIDKTYAMRWGTFSMLPENIISYCRSSLDLDESGIVKWLDLQCCYAEICVEVNKHVLSVDSNLDNSTFLALATRLKVWHDSVLEDAKTGGNFTTGSAVSSISPARQVAICVSYQYHEAVLALLSIFNPSLPLGSSINEQTNSNVLSVTKRIFLDSHKIDDFIFNKTLLYVPTLALCSLAVDCLAGSVGNPKDARQVFAMAYGLFGRLAASLPSEGFLDQVMELLNIMIGN